MLKERFLTGGIYEYVPPPRHMAIEPEDSGSSGTNPVGSATPRDAGACFRLAQWGPQPAAVRILRIYPL